VSRLAGLRRAFDTYADPGVATMLLLGFASGLPFPMVLTTLSARLRQAGIDRTTIGLFSLVGLAYSLKFFWSPIVDRVRLPLFGALGQRRGWMLLAQLGVIAGMIAMALHDPAQGATTMAALAVATAFCAATQDIAVDAYRIESANADRQGAAVAAYQIGYQLALIAAGAGALVAASGHGWTVSYLVIAAAMAVGPVTVLAVREPLRTAATAIAPERLQATIARLRPVRLVAALALTFAIGAGLSLALRAAGQSSLVVDVSFGAIAILQLGLLALLAVPPLRPALEWLVASVVLPLVEFFERNGVRIAVPILLLILFYRLNYTTMGVAANTFYLDLGYTLDQIALVSKVYGVLMTLGGALLAGWLVKRLGALPTMLLGLLLLSGANLFYGYIAERFAVAIAAPVGDAKLAAAPALSWLSAAVSFDNVGNGIAGTAFIAYMSSLTNSAYTATQYALFGTLWSLPAKSLASQWGRIVDHYGYPPFFVYTAAVALPALLLLLWFLRRPPLPQAEAPRSV